ncbi:MAG: prolipoprotein diacylglyceryl transferase family protein [Anaerolineales bacterium]
MPNAYPWIFSLTALGTLLGLGWVRARRARLSDVEDARSRFDAGAAGLAGGLIGARLGYLAWHLGYLRLHPAEILAFWHGGLDWFGGVLGGLLGVWVYSRTAGRPFLELADGLAAPGLVLGLAAWLGCWVDGCAYGRIAPAGWWAPISPDSFGTLAPRWPTQAGAFLLTLIPLAVLLRLDNRSLAHGLRACLAVAAAAAVILLVSAGRGDASVAILDIRGDALAAVLLIAAALAVGRRLSSPRAAA